MVEGAFKMAKRVRNRKRKIKRFTLHSRMIESRARTGNYSTIRGVAPRTFRTAKFKRIVDRIVCGINPEDSRQIEVLEKALESSMENMRFELDETPTKSFIIQFLEAVDTLLLDEYGQPDPNTVVPFQICYKNKMVYFSFEIDDYKCVKLRLSVGGANLKLQRYYTPAARKEGMCSRYQTLLLMFERYAHGPVEYRSTFPCRLLEQLPGQLNTSGGQISVGPSEAYSEFIKYANGHQSMYKFYYTTKEKSPTVEHIIGVEGGVKIVVEENTETGKIVAHPGN